MRKILPVVVLAASIGAFADDAAYAVAESPGIAFSTRLDAEMPEGALVHSGIIGADETWAAGSEHFVWGTVTVPIGVTLTIERGATVRFLGGGISAYYGSVVAEGVLFTDVADGTALARPSYELKGNIATDGDTRIKFAKTFMPYDSGESESTALNLRLDAEIPAGAAIHSGAVAVDETWVAGTEHVVYGSVIIAEGATLTIEPGAVVRFLGGGLYAMGECIAHGIVFTDIADGTALARPSYELKGNIATDEDTRVKFAKGGSEIAKVAESDAFALFTGTNRLNIVAESASISFSTEWDASSSVTVEVTGPGGATETLTNATALASGVIDWHPASGAGLYGFRHLTDTNTLEATIFAVEGAEVHEGALAGECVWTADKVHIVNGTLTVISGAMLTIEPGAIVKFVRGGQLHIANGGECIAEGVVFTSAADDTVGGDTFADGGETAPGAGDWTILGFVRDDIATEYRYGVQSYAGILSGNVEWRREKTYVIDGTLTVATNGALTIPAGTVVKFTDRSSLAVQSGGVCIAEGAIFTHIADDTVGGDTMGDDDETVPEYGRYTVAANVIDDDTTEYRYSAPIVISGVLNGNNIWRARQVYHVTGDLTLASGATLDIAAGSIIKFDIGCSLTVNSGATLNAQGTRAAPIVFTSIKDDTHGGDTNEDGDRTYADFDDWRKIQGDGNVTMNYCKILWATSGRNGGEDNNTGALYPTGGNWIFDNSMVAHCTYDCMRSYGGTFTANNSVFMDAAIGVAPAGGTARFNNCVFHKLKTAVRWGNGIFYNCVFNDMWQDIIDTKFYSSTLGSRFYNCCFWSPEGTGDHAGAKVGQNECFYANPLLVDPDNGDFRIAASSPCVDAGDGTVAPETDYYGQPRMDVKTVADTGVPDADGICPDIGIYEVPGATPTPLPDLAVLEVAIDSETAVKPGDSITITYVVTNRGAAAATGLVRDLVRFKGADAATGGLDADAGEIERAYNIAAGEAATFQTTATVPALKAGAWKAGVAVNRYNHPYEQNLSNNSAWTDEAIEVELEAMGLGTHPVTIGSSETAGYVLNDLPEAGGIVRVIGDRAANIAAYGGNGTVPAAGGSLVCTTINLGDGSLLIVFPARSEEEGAYLVLENASRSSASVSVEVTEAIPAIYGVSPTRIANVQEATITITGSALDAERVTLGGRTAKSVEKINAAQIAATFDVDGMAEGTYAIAAGAASLAGAVEVFAAKEGPKLRAWLEMPSSVRDGRVFTGYVCYANEGDSPMTMPCFKVERLDSSTKLGLEASESLAETKLFIGGISPTHPAGVLKAGDEARIPFYFQPFGTYRLKLTHTEENDDASAFPLFGGTREYLAAMSAAATRLNLRGRTDYNIHNFVNQALWEKNGASCAAASGYLVDANTLEPIAHAGISLVAASSDAQGSVPPATGTTDAEGYFQLTNLADGQYIWLLDGGNTLADASTNTVTISGQADLNGLRIYAAQGGRISGYVMTEALAPLGGATVTLMNEDGSVSMAEAADALGSFTFTGLPDGIYSVRSMPANGYTASIATDIAIDAASRQVEVALEAVRGAVLNGSVTFNGSAVTNGIVQAALPDGTALETLCGLDGSYAFDGIPAGRYAVRYYSNEALSGEVEVTLAQGEKATLDIVAAERAIFMPTMPVGYGTCTTGFFMTDATRAQGVLEWAWDFDSDGIIDSTDPEPTWTYYSIGSYTVTLRITEEAGTTTSVYEECVEVREEVPTILAAGAIVEGINARDLAVVSATDDSLTLSGDPASGVIAAGNVILIADGEEVYSRRVLSSAKSSGLWQLQTENADPTDAYSQFAFAVSAQYAIEETPTAPAVKLASANGKTGKFQAKAIPVNSDGDGFSLISKAEVAVTGTITPHLNVFWINEYRNGRNYQKRGFAGSLELGLSGAFEGTLGATYTASIPVPVKIKIPTSVPFLSVTGEGTLYASVTGQAKGKLGVSAKIQPTVTVAWECIDGGDWKRLPAFEQPKGESPIQVEADIEGYLEVRIGFKPKIGLQWTAVKVAAEADVFLADEFKASLRAPAEFNSYMGADISGVTSFVVLGKELPSWVSPTLEGPRFNLFHWQAAKPDFEWTPAKDIKVGESVSFTNKTGMESAQVLFFGEQEARPKGYKWEFSNGQAAVETQDAVTSFPEEALYRVYLQALGTLYTGPYRVGHWVSIGEPEEEPDKGENDKNDEKQDTGKQSCDPNELDGPMGIGEARLVKPGEWMDYTIYFENMAGFDIADAQDVRVANLLSGWLDWNTFEMREVAFNNQCDVGLDGLANGTSEIRMNGTDKFVQTTVRLDAADGIAEWYMRVYDPNGTFGWPNDGSGFLPSNDDTHRGEGHITYRIKVRDDAPGNVVITNTATIVFDYNDPIETDPAWWNTVAEMAHVSFSIDGVVTNLDIIAGQPYGELPEPAPRTGYTFAGWFTGANGTGERITASSIAQAGVTALYAYYSANTYAVRFNANGGACAESTRTVAYGTRIGTLPVATRDGYTFKGWGINADYIVTDDITLVAEWDEIIIPPPPPPTPKTEVWTVTFDANGGVCGEASRAVTNDCAIGVLPIATRECYTFAGWGVDAAYIVTSNITLVAAWNAYELYPDGDDPVGGEFGVATVWDAFVHDEASPVPAGTVQVKLAKAKTDKKSGLVTAKAAATVQLPGEKKVSLKGNAVVADDGTCTLSAANGANEMELVFCGRSVTGRYNSHRVQGARNIFTSKLAADKTLASNLARIVTGALNIAWSGGTITASFAAKGKVKIAGASVNGAKISVNTQAIAGESIVAIPVVVLKGVSLAANIYIASDGSELSIAGLDGARIGRAGELRDGLLFTTGATDETVTLTLKNGKPSVPKADKLKVVNGDLATIADNGNPIALKFTYTAKTGAFKGSFTLFEVAAGKLKKQAATFTGVFIEGIGYGTAVIKKLGLAWPVEVK